MEEKLTYDENGKVHGYVHRYFYKSTVIVERANFIHGNVKGYYEWHRDTYRIHTKQTNFYIR